ncbi:MULTISPECIES: hypothetical protein [unclassified Leptospira]|uniref:hypothetical protein n=1 Tax=unclassified Leptospira TaxID=2633828 RepID=UPI0002BF0BC9|nr:MULTISPECIES: hypothetical protein [unclassified Leptospira]EMK00042.1 hypothetical protein LEP1GSC192_0859 [Leptospira sp. B5-022]MCR1794034.1 hypothetical protein [Leptospira sp. id769339]
MRTCIQIFKTKVIPKIKGLFSKESLETFKTGFTENVLKDPKVGVPTGAGVLFLAIGFYLSFKGYSIDSAIKDPALLIPKKANLLVEVYRPEEFVEDLEKTNLGRELSEDGTFQKILTVPELRKISSVLYLLEAKAGVMTKPSRLAALFDGPVAVATFPKSNFLLVGKASASSKLGVSLITGFKGEKIVVKETPKEEKPQTPPQTEEGYYTPTGSETTHSADDFADQFAAGSEKFGNLEAFKYEFGSGKILAIVLGDFIILTDSEDLLEKSLDLASSVNNDSLGNQRGFDTLRKEASKKENKVLFFAGTDSLIAPFLKPSFGDSGAALLLGWETGKNLEGKVYKIGGDKNQVVSSGPGLSKVIPRETNLVFYSEELKPSEVWKSLETISGEWEELGEGLNAFGKNAGIHEQYFGSEKGIAFSFNGLEYKSGMVYPRFGISLPASVPDDKLLKAIFKVGNPIKVSYQNTNLESYPLRKGGFYTPASLKVGNWKYLASDRKSAEETVSSGNGNRPNQADLFSSGPAKELAYYPHHLVVRVPGILEDLKSFYLYGAEGSPEYTSKTIERDVQPILDKLKVFERLVVSFGSGKEGEDWGKLKIF